MSVSVTEQNDSIEITEPIKVTTVTGPKEYVAIDNGEGISTVMIEDPTLVAITEAFTEIVRISNEEVSITEIGVQGPSGSDGSGATVNTIPLELPDDSRVMFTTPSEYAQNTLQVYLNGLLESHITPASPNMFTFSEAPYTGDDIRIIYKTN